jgi:mannose-6-phosphate isomerase-like protein (cupin superfamily)
MVILGNTYGVVRLMPGETAAERADRILRVLRSSFPGKSCYEVDGRGVHFVCEVEPVDKDSGWDKAVEVIISSTPRKHEHTTQRYRVLAGTLELHVNDASILLREGETYFVEPKTAHWATSEDEAVVEIRSRPGWTADDHHDLPPPRAPQPD